MKTEALASATTKKGRCQRAVLAVLEDHAAQGALPTSGRFVFYELEQQGQATKTTGTQRSSGWPPGPQDVTDALTQLREVGVVPWHWIVDETRSVTEYAHAPSVLDFVLERVEEARINPWHEPPPLLLCESRATAGVLDRTAQAYVCPIAGTSGYTRGFLEVEVVPLLRGNERRVLYLGDLDLSGNQIEHNSRRVLERGAGRRLSWTRLALTAEQAAGMTPITKSDGRYRPSKPYEAFEVEALGQAAVVSLVEEALTALLPEPLGDVLERERAQTLHLRRYLDLYKPEAES